MELHCERFTWLRFVDIKNDKEQRRAPKFYRHRYSFAMNDHANK
jgi:hypothetical protein